MMVLSAALLWRSLQFSWRLRKMCACDVNKKEARAGCCDEVTLFLEDDVYISAREPSPSVDLLWGTWRGKVVFCLLYSRVHSLFILSVTLNFTKSIFTINVFPFSNQNLFFLKKKKKLLDDDLFNSSRWQEEEFSVDQLNNHLDK